MKTTIAFFSGIILGALITGILVDQMASKMWVDMHIQTKTEELTLTVKGLEELQNGNREGAIAILEGKIDDDLQFGDDELGTLSMPEGTRKLFMNALDSAAEYRTRHPKTE
jgi:hypothetical protein